MKKNKNYFIILIIFFAVIFGGLLTLIFFDKPDNDNNKDNLILSNECFRYTEEGIITETYCDDEEHKTLVIPKEINGTIIRKIEKISMYNIETLIIADTIDEIDTIEYNYEDLALKNKIIINESNILKLDCNKYKKFNIYTVNFNNLVNGTCEKTTIITEKTNKEVPIEINLTKTHNYEMVDNLTMSSEKVVISGYKEILEDIKSIDAYINVDNLSNNTYKAYLEKPTMIDSVNQENIDVNITIGKVITKEYVVNLQLLNNDKNYKLVEEDNSQITVIAKGTSNNISRLKTEDIIAHIDLKNAFYDVEEIPVQLQTSNNKIKLISTTRIIKLTNK